MAFGLARTSAPFGCLACVAAICGWLPLATYSSAAAGPTRPLVLSLCSEATRATGATAKVEAGSLEARAVCVRDSDGAASESAARVRLPFAAPDGALRSISSPEWADTIKINRVLRSRRQTLTILRADGRPCANVSATAARPSAALKRFVGADWASSVDYMIDAQCASLAIRLGNRLALVPLREAGATELYGIRFSIAR